MFSFVFWLLFDNFAALYHWINITNSKELLGNRWGTRVAHL